MNAPILSQAPRMVVLGSLNMDLVLRVPHMPRAGETMLGQSLTQVPGGKGGNQAVSCARQGAAVTLLSCVGEDAYAEQLLAGLLTDHIDVQHVQRSSLVGTGVAVISVDDAAQNQIVVVPGANDLLRVPEALLERLLRDAAGRGRTSAARGTPRGLQNGAQPFAHAAFAGALVADGRSAGGERKRSHAVQRPARRRAANSRTSRTSVAGAGRGASGGYAGRQWCGYLQRTRHYALA